MDAWKFKRYPPPYTLWQLVGYFLGLGTYGFGGPVALVGYMHRDLVERRGWIAEADYREGMALAQLAPGPLAAQLAIYLGYVHYRILGATIVGIAFVLPSFFMVLALGWAYVLYGGLNWMQAVFYGVGAAVIGIIAYSAYKLTRKSIGKDRLLWLVYLANAVATVITESELVWLVLASGILVWIERRGRSWKVRRHLRYRLDYNRHSCCEQRNALADCPVLYASGCLRFWQWTRNHSVSIRRRRY